ncbi:MAG: hypothetical protein J6Z34_05750 [Clostridia bacterium]|nr:hypothetical protein [Clostridia bacterium]
MDGAVVYETNYLDSHSYNVEPGAVESNAITVNSTMNLYAVWERAYTNMFGGNDYLFIPDLNARDAYLYRGGIYFKGRYDDYTREVSFSIVDGYEEKLIFSCRVNTDHTYCYYDPSRAELEYSLYSGGDQLDRQTTVKFDEYNGIIFTENRSSANEQRSIGTYLLNGADEYEITFTFGPHTGEKMFIRLSSISLSGVSDIRVFRIRNDDEMNLGTLKRCIIYTGATNEYVSYGNLVQYASYYALTLSGFGTAQMASPDGTVNYIYEKEGDKITLTNAVTSAVMVVKLIGQDGYIEYNEELDGEFFTSDEDASLTLDGMYNATYTDAQGVEYSAFFSYTPSVFDGYVVTVHARMPVGDLSFVIRKTVETTGGGMIGEDQEETEKTVKYELQVKNSGYAEYYFRYKDPDSGVINTYIVPLLIINDTEIGVADFYGLRDDTNERTFVKIAHGDLTAIDDYRFKIENFTVDEETESYGLFNIYDVSSLVYSYEDYLGYNSYYIISAFNKAGREIGGLSRTYTNGTDSLILASAGFFIAYTGENVFHGTFEQEGNIVAVNAVIMDSSGRLFYELDGNSFTELETEPYSAYLFSETGTDYDRNTYISFDGKGGASYFENGVKLYDGTVEKTGHTTRFDSSVDIYSFTANGGGFSFDYIRLYIGVTSLYSPFSQTYNDAYVSAYGRLVLDGYGYNAEYTDVEGIVYSGRYSVYEENVIRLNHGEGYFYFDLSGRSFSKRGVEYGTYVFTDNQSFTGVMVTLDGYGKALAFTLNEENDEKTYIDRNGTYTIGEDGLVTVNYSTEGGGVTHVGKFGISLYNLGSGRYPEITRLYGEVVMSYVQDDNWTVLTLEDNGQATLYDSKGNVQNGTYVLITDDLLYFEDIVNVENGYLFDYDTVAGSIYPVKNSERGYYTHELESLVFSKAGFAVFNHEEKYYYTVNDGNIVLYKKDADDENSSKYGFVEIEFGTFESEMIYKGKTYYANNGYSINFMRADLDEDKDEDGNFIYLLPVSEDKKAAVTELSFAPSGERTFAGVSGTAKIGGVEYNCNVYRELDGETDELVTYARIGDFYIYVDVEFGGVDLLGNSLSSFRVKSVKRIAGYNAYKYIDGYYRIYVSQGPVAARNYLMNDNYGILTMSYEYNEKGDTVSSYVDAEFGDLTGLYDMDGNVVKLEHAVYETRESDRMFRVTLESGGYVYRLYFFLELHSIVRATGYYIYAFTREETIMTADGTYKVSVERYIASDSESRVKGSFMQVGLAVKTEETDEHGDYIYEEIKLAGGLTNAGNTYFLSRTFEQVDLKDDKGETVVDDNGDPVKTNGKLLSSVYYKVTFIEEDNNILNDENFVNVYKSATVEKMDMTVYVSEDGKSFVEIPENGMMIVFVYDGTSYFVESGSYDTGDKTYSLTVTTGDEFTITLNDDGTAVFTRVTDDDDVRG